VVAVVRGGVGGSGERGLWGLARAVAAAVGPPPLPRPVAGRVQEGGREDPPPAGRSHGERGRPDRQGSWGDSVEEKAESQEALAGALRD
jgi:hypothetical protein